IVFFPLSLHDALPIFGEYALRFALANAGNKKFALAAAHCAGGFNLSLDRKLHCQWLQSLSSFAAQISRPGQINRDRRGLSSLRRSEEHTSELQSLAYL